LGSSVSDKERERERERERSALVSPGGGGWMGKERKGASCDWFSLCVYSYIYVLLCLSGFY